MITVDGGRLLRSTEAPARQRAMVDYLRAMVLGSQEKAERFHAIFLDELHVYLGDVPMGLSGVGSLSVRMRDLFSKALSVRASGIIIAHNHPSGLCWPSQSDLDATCRLKDIAGALDIELVDHLIITQDAVYSMRAGGNL